MEDLLNAMRAQFDVLNLNFRVAERHNANFAVVEIAGVRVSVYRRQGSGSAIILGRSFRRPYNVGKIATHFLSKLPGLMDIADKDRERKENIELAKELANAHKDDPRLTIGYSGEKFYVSFGSFYTDVAVVADYLHEWGSDPDAMPKVREKLPRLYATVYSDEELSEPYDLFMALKYVAPDEYDEIVDMSVGATYSNDADFYMRRVQ